ncbi:MAG: SRPBCC family protein [Alphaproteobacteria bacterium]
MNIDKAYELSFSAEKVFATWVSSDTVIAPATRMDIDPVVGGHYRLFMETPDYSARAEGVFLVVEAGSHIRYSWEWNGDGEVTEIDVAFTPNGSGTRLRILHTGFTKEESVAMHESGWDSYVEGLVTFVSAD